MKIFDWNLRCLRYRYTIMLCVGATFVLRVLVVHLKQGMISEI